jgi:hypothetical protein
VPISMVVRWLTWKVTPATFFRYLFMVVGMTIGQATILPIMFKYWPDPSAFLFAVVFCDVCYWWRAER